jgi:hypothetical protein
MKTTKTSLAFGVAGAAIAIASTSPAHAACTTSTSTVTCADTSTVNDANTAIAGVTGADVTLQVSSGGALNQPGTNVSPGQQGAVTIVNAGILGTPAAPVDIFYTGTALSAANKFVLTNGGTVTGNVDVRNFGGSANIDGTGAIGGYLVVFSNAVAPVTVTTGSSVAAASGFGAFVGSGGASALNVAGVVGSAATSTTPSNLKPVFVQSVAGSGTNNTTSATAAGVTTTTTTSTSDVTGSTAALAIGAKGIAGASNVTGLVGATVVVDGAIGAKSQVSDVTANSQFNASKTTNVSTSGPAGTSFNNETTITAKGGAASVTVNKSGSVSGSATALADADAVVANAGTIAGSSNAQSARTISNAHTINAGSTTISGTGADQVTTFASNSQNDTTAFGTKASTTNAEGASIGGSATVTGIGGASLTNAGAVGSSASVQSIATNSSSKSANSSKFNATGQFLSSTGSSDSTSTSVGGTASLDNAATGSLGTVTSGSILVRGLAGSTLTNAGLVDEQASVISTGSTSRSSGTSDQANTYGTTGILSANTSKSSNQSSSASTGSDASVLNQAGGAIGTATGAQRFVSISANGNASLDNAGLANGGVNIAASGSKSASSSANGNQNQYDSKGNFTGGGSTSSSQSSSDSTGGNASLVNRATGLIGATEAANVPVSLFANGTSTATNSGRINGNLTVTTSGSHNESTNTSKSDFVNDPATGSNSSTSSSTNSSANSSTGGKATVTNASNAIVVGAISASGQGGVTMDNQGVVTGRTTLTASPTTSANQSSSQSASAFTAGTTGGTVNDSSSSSTSTTTQPGANVSGTYAGVNGAVQFAPTGASDGSISQSATGVSAATITGSLLGNYNGTATGATVNSSNSNTAHSEFNAVGAQIAGTNSNTNHSDTTYTGGSSTLAINGGTVGFFSGASGGNVTVSSDKSASIDLTGGASVAGSALVSTNSVAQYSKFTSDNANATVNRYTTAGVFTGRDTSSTGSSSFTAGAGTASASLAGSTIDGNARVNGAGGGATLTVAADAAIGGSANVSAYTFTSSSSNKSTSTFVAAAGAKPATNASTSTSSNTYADQGGDVSATVAGSIGGGIDAKTGHAAGAIAKSAATGSSGVGLSVASFGGNASASITGQVRGGINVQAADYGGSGSSTSTSTNNADGSSSSTSQGTSLDIGGTATLTVDTPATAAAKNLPANFGNITVAGVSGSSASIGSTSTVLAGNSATFLSVGGNFYSQTSSDTASTTAAGIVTDTNVATAKLIDNAASLVNKGVIGYDGGAAFNGNLATVRVSGTGGDTATNNGRIFGSVTVDGIGANTTTTTTTTNGGDVTQITKVTTVSTAVGGAATLTNTGLVTGSAAVDGATGTLTNSGVIRGNLTLGRQVENDTTTRTDTFAKKGVTFVTDAPATPFAQTYTVAQTGLVGGKVTVAGAFGPTTKSDGTKVKTSAITAAITLGSGSVTVGGVAAEYNEGTGARATTTTVTLDGSGYVGLDATAVTALGKSFATTDPAIALAGDLSGYTGGARITGVDSLTKTGSGTFTIVGAGYTSASNIDPLAHYTLDLGSFQNTAGTIQLAVMPAANQTTGTFGIRGDVNNTATLVLGRLVNLPAPLFGSTATVQGVSGIQIYQKGNFTQGAAGTLVVGLMPTLVRVVDPTLGNVTLSSNPLAVQQIQVAQGVFVTPKQAFGSAAAALTPSFVTLDGNLNLAGKVSVLTPVGGLFLGGQSLDLFSVSGTVANSATVAASNPSNFVNFTVSTRQVNGQTIVSLGATRKSYGTAALSSNAAAAGVALDAALADVVPRLAAYSASQIPGATASATTPFLSTQDYASAQDLATVLSGLDSVLTPAQASQALTELASGSYYGSLATITTTAPFVDVLSSRRVASDAKGFNFWLQPTGDFIRFDGSSVTGASKLHATNYGVSGGFGVEDGSGEFGIGFGYSRTNTHSDDRLAQAKADSWMVGAYGRQAFGPVSIAADLVFGFSNWNASRQLPTLSRVAAATFDSKEVRGDLRAEYNLEMGSAEIAPFAQVRFRHFSFDGFAETGAGSVGLNVNRLSETEVTPTVGVRVGGRLETAMATLRPEASVSYSFDNGNHAFRDVSFEGSPANSFRLQGVNPKGYVTFEAGLTGEIGPKSSAFVRAGYSTSGGNNVGSVRAGIVIGF